MTWQAGIKTFDFMNKFFSGIFLCVFICLISGCGSSLTYAPVIKPLVPVSKPGYYYVRPGDTLYSIAWAFGLDYKTLAKINGIKDDQQIQPNQYLIINPNIKPAKKLHKGFHKSPPVKVIKTKTSVKIHRARLRPVKQWHWPVHGKVLNIYNPAKGEKGINIRGHYGSKIKAAAAGIVVYAGNGLRAYGQLIILKNSRNYLSAYAYNARILVKEGQYVKQNQVIALMGRSPFGKVMLHFEIRRNGKPVNPLALLQ